MCPAVLMGAVLRTYRQPAGRRRIRLALEAVCVAGTAIEAFLYVADGASFWVAIPLLSVLAAELLAHAAGLAVKARSRYYRRKLERSKERLLSAEASVWMSRRDGE